MIPDSFLTLDSAWSVVTAFLISAGVILLAGIRLSKTADQLADKTGLGEALVGSVLLGSATSLSGLTMSVAAAAGGQAELAVSNCLGGIAAQTLFLSAADAAYKKANLEHAAASLENLLQGSVLIGTLSLVVMAVAAPSLQVFSIHPVSILIVGLYVLGLKITQSARDAPGWKAKLTAKTKTDEPDQGALLPSLTRLVLQFVGLAFTVALAGFLVSRAANGAVEVFGLRESVVGTFMTAIVTSLPELVTTVAAVRRGALTLAVGGIIGGNAFDILFLAASDVAYREGSIYKAVSQDQAFLVGLSIAMTAVLLMGLLRRQEKGPAGIGFETWLTMALYFAGSWILVTLR